MNFSPVIQKSILQHHSLWQEEGESRTSFVHHKQPQLFAQLPVITLLCFFHHSNVSFQLFFLCKCSRINTSQHFVVLIASPVSACNAHQLVCLANILGAHQVRACTQICKLTLLIEADFLAFRKILNQLHLVRLLFFLHESNGFLSGQSKALNRKSFLYNLLHLRFDLFQILCCNRILKIHIIIKSICNRGTDCQLGAGIQALNCLCHYVAGRMTQSSQTLLVLCSQNIKRTILFQNGTQIYCLSIYFTGTCHPCQTFA